MPVGEISALMASLRAATDITKAFIGLRDEAMIQSKVIELQAMIMNAQQSAMGAQNDQIDLIERISKLEKEKAELVNWDQEKRRYELREFPPGVFLYILRDDASEGEPIHRLCPKCFSCARKAILQTRTKNSNSGGGGFGMPGMQIGNQGGGLSVPPRDRRGIV